MRKRLALIVIVALVVTAVALIVIFDTAKAPTTETQLFKGPTGQPYVKGPTGPPPSEPR